MCSIGSPGRRRARSSARWSPSATTARSSRTSCGASTTPSSATGDFLDHLGLFGKGLSLLLEQGIYKGEYLKQWLAQQLGAKDETTFGDIKLLDPGGTSPVDKQYRLVVMASDVSHGELCRFPWSYGSFGVQPDSAEIVEAVRASMSIPFFYAPQKMKSGAGGDYWFHDGGMLSNLAIDVFDRTDQQRPRWPSFGNQVVRAGRRRAGRPAPHQGLDHARRGDDWHDVTGFYDRMHIDDNTQQLLYDSGRAAATKFLDGGEGATASDWDAYLEKYWKPAGP